MFLGVAANPRFEAHGRVSHVASVDTTAGPSGDLDVADGEDERTSTSTADSLADTRDETSDGVEADGYGPLSVTIDETERVRKETQVDKTTVREGKLIRHGITAGVGYAVSVPLGDNDDDIQVAARSVGNSAMPYLLMLPWYWRGNITEANRSWCASEWTGKSWEERQKIAGAEARVQAREWVDALLDRARSRASLEELEAYAQKIWPTAVGDSALPYPSKTFEIIFALIAAERNEKAAENARDYEHLVNAVAKELWRPTQSVKCAGSKFGFWLGYPTSFDVSIRRMVDGQHQENDRAVTSCGGGGIAVAPNAYVAFMVGMSCGVFKPDDDGSARRIVGTFVVSIGGNLDLVGLLFGR